MSVVRNPHSLPRITQSGVGIVKASTWDVGTPERQRAAVAAIAAAWEKRDWPDENLLSYSVYTGNDGRTLFHYSQWADEESYRFWLSGGRSDTVAEIDAAVPDIERLWLHTYELYRSSGSAGDAGRVPGAIIVIDIGFDGPDPARQRAWVDGVFEALESDPAPAPGGISGHFHVSVDGTRVLNYAEWESAQAHSDALAGGEGIGSATPEWYRVQSFPGVTGVGMRRYTPALSLSGGAAGA
ncbi:antibiotic biosynthesis monooxygenase [Rhodococcus oryzae]|uniref:Antibiotic biosynthesis monooxygenase n=1 Tax=Rhodococcus oryzae TaxID=2571143 RepID=A0ABY2RLW8_9NOCA|nr:antibiotic biosynthesis monooxygenase [Rhodococcus oryzae]TJZ79287.1 antibiotic biosynthesis monooxygenase [Rhodococcus oryzae]